jgi:hypothetical protein
MMAAVAATSSFMESGTGSGLILEVKVGSVGSLAAIF